MLRPLPQHNRRQQTLANRFAQAAAAHWPRYRPSPRLTPGPLPVSFVITSMPVGGAEVLLANLIRQFDRQRIAPEVICLKHRGPLGEKLRDVCPVHEKLLAHKCDLRVFPRLVRHFRQQQTAAIVTVGAGDKMFWGRLAAYTAGVPVVLSALHSTGWPDGVGRLNRCLTAITDGFIAVALDHAKHLREGEGFPPEKVFAIPNGVDTGRFHSNEEARHAVRKQLAIAPTAPVLGIVAALRPEKNHAMFLRVAARIRQHRPDAHFLVIGDGPERAAIERQRDELGLRPWVHLLGSRDDTPRWLAALDLFLLCSHNEASPVSILEALACQVPVIATRVGSVHETVREGQTGFLVAVDDDRAMTDHALDLLEHHEARRVMGEKGRGLIQESYSLEAMVTGYTRLLERLHHERARYHTPTQATPQRPATEAIEKPTQHPHPTRKKSAKDPRT